MGGRVQNHDYIAWLGNSASLAAIAGTIMGLLPPLAALAAIAWYLLQMYESKTYRDWRDERLRRKKERKIARLVAKQKVIAAELEALATLRAAKDFAEHMVKAATVKADDKVQAAKVDAAILAAENEEKK